MLTSLNSRSHCVASSGFRLRGSVTPKRPTRIGGVPTDPDERELLALPPVAEIKQAIARQRVCQGITYVLPVDKTKNSVENVFRSDLRVMFTDPYRSEAQRMYQERLSAVAKHHFQPNTASREYNWSTPIGYSLNSGSERARRNFARSAPTRYAQEGKSLDTAQPRSLLHLPVANYVQPEVEKLREEAETILLSVGLKTDQKGAVCLNDGADQSEEPTAPLSSHVTRTHAQQARSASPVLEGRSRMRLRRRVSQSGSGRSSELPQGSRYLSEVKNSDIWRWLDEREAPPRVAFEQRDSN